MLGKLSMLALTGVFATAGLIALPSIASAAHDQNTYSTANGVWNSRNPGHSWRTTAWNGDRGWQQRRDRDDRRRYRRDRVDRGNGGTWNAWNAGNWNNWNGNWNGNNWNNWNGSSWNNGNHYGRGHAKHRDRDDRRWR
jgi:hypothetical protein